MTPLLIPYPSYASSSIPWPGCIPNHWKIARIKSQMDNVVDLTRRSSRGDIYVALEHVESWTGKIRDAGDDVNFESQVKRFQERDVLFGKLRPYLAKVTAPTVAAFVQVNSSYSALSATTSPQNFLRGSCAPSPS